MSFGRFPSKWVKDGGLWQFSAKTRQGDHIAALKLYLVAAAYGDFSSWTATMSLSDIEDVTKLSRPMIVRGGNVLVNNRIILKGRSKQTSTYLMMVEGSPSWAKVPQDIIRRGLRSIPNRGRTSLACLRAYILFLALRDNKTNETKISYERISRYIGVRAADMRSAISILVNCGFIEVIRARYDELDEESYSHNVYVMKGDFKGSMVRHMRPNFSETSTNSSQDDESPSIYHEPPF